MGQMSVLVTVSIVARYSTSWIQCIMIQYLTKYRHMSMQYDTESMCLTNPAQKDVKYHPPCCRSQERGGPVERDSTVVAIHYQPCTAAAVNLVTSFVRKFLSLPHRVFSVCVCVCCHKYQTSENCRVVGMGRGMPCERTNIILSAGLPEKNLSN